MILERELITASSIIVLDNSNRNNYCLCQIYLKDLHELIHNLIACLHNQKSFFKGNHSRKVRSGYIEMKLIEVAIYLFFC